MNQKHTQSVDKDIQEDIKKLVLARIKAMSDELGIVIGSKEYSKDKIIHSIEKEDALGKEVMGIQMEFLRDMAEGIIYQTEA